MVSWPSFTDPQFLDANGVGGLNAAMGVVSGAIAGAGSGTWAVPGLIAPEAMTVSFSGLVATVGLPQPWGLIASSGTVVRAHGTQTGTDTTSYSVSFASLVPGSGSLTAYLVATITQIQQNPFPITGPPPGDPAYNPNFVPTVGYATNQYSVSLAAVSGGINNTSSFELFRTTLTTGQSTITSYNTVGQVRAGNRVAQPALTLASGGVLTQAQSQYALVPSTSGLTHTLPPVTGAGGLTYCFVNPNSGAETVSTTGSDLIIGTASGAVSSFAIPASGSVTLYANATAAIPSWEAVGASPNIDSAGRLLNVQVFTSNGTYTPTTGMKTVIFKVQGGGGAGGGSDSIGIGGSAVSLGSPGTSGTYSEGIFTAVLVGASKSVTVGAGGTGSSGGPGTNGGTSSVGALITAPGGIGGNQLYNQIPPTVNGNGTNSSPGTGANIFSAIGTAGSASFAISTAIAITGAGGNSLFGPGSYSTQINGAGVNGINFGSGGAATIVNSAGGTTTGGNGANGIIIAYEYS